MPFPHQFMRGVRHSPSAAAATGALSGRTRLHRTHWLMRSGPSSEKRDEAGTTADLLVDERMRSLHTGQAFLLRIVPLVMPV
jgi:hypothetical protein